jgi:hypothetical protein
MSNIFMLPGSLGEEDLFTARLHHLIESDREIGQHIVEAILHSAKRPISKFKSAVNHPNVGSENQPDFLLQCEDFDIFCEHKLLSPLGNRQLERYLGISWKRPFYVALISLGSCVVSQDVRDDPKYLYPDDAMHFDWRDIYPVIGSRQHALGQDFTAYMNSLGMKPLPHDWKRLFTDGEKAKYFGKHLEVVRKLGPCRIDPARLGIQLSAPAQGIQLFYICVEPAVSRRIRSVDGDVLVARVYVRADSSASNFKASWRIPFMDSFEIQGNPIVQGAAWDQNLSLVYEYQTPLWNVLSNNERDLEVNLLEFASLAFRHACGFEGENGTDEMESTAN